MAIIKTISDLLWGMPLIVLIMLAGIIFTVGSKFFQIAHLKHILKNTIGTLFSKKDNGKGMMKPLEVISIAVGGAVGVGNIAAWRPLSRWADRVQPFGFGLRPFWA